MGPRNDAVLLVIILLLSLPLSSSTDPIAYKLVNWLIKYPDACPTSCLSVETYDELLSCLEIADVRCYGTVGLGPHGNESLSDICFTGLTDSKHRIGFPNLLTPLTEELAVPGLTFRNAYYGSLALNFSADISLDICEYYLTPLNSDPISQGSLCGLDWPTAETIVLTNIILTERTIFLDGNIVSTADSQWIGITSSNSPIRCGGRLTNVHWDIQRTADWSGTLMVVSKSERAFTISSLTAIGGCLTILGLGYV